MVLLLTTDNTLVDQICVALGNRTAVQRAGSARDARALVNHQPWKWVAVAIDFSREPERRAALVGHLVQRHHRIAVIALVPREDMELAFRLARSGVNACIPLPADTGRLAQSFSSAVVDVPPLLAAEEVSLQQAHEALAPLVGTSPAIQKLRAAVVYAARSGTVPVLLTGETGAGKQVVARVLHAISARCEAPFVDVNVCAITETLFEGELFGSVEGAFTGAVRRRGYVRAAHGGTLFLDEIGDLSAALQPKLLKVVEDGVVRPLGADKGEAVDIRIISATNRNLAARVRCGTFRRDLWHRLAGIEIAVPPLRHRLEDVPHLCRAILGTTAYRHMVVRPDAIRALQHHRWRGNVRELRSVLERSAALCRSPQISVGDLLFDHRLMEHTAALPVM